MAMKAAAMVNARIVVLTRDILVTPELTQNEFGSFP
jgi:hypothetical protein